ncbi:hypothetical protein [Pedobacter aquatilis]|uniref:hypothetical protein n=1 Tax=Pedobacter aquatilis TaxID=351343 RepID=UPI002931F098|nr:hypothetical protein [Pedobacter aquatilis]
MKTTTITCISLIFLFCFSMCKKKEPDIYPARIDIRFGQKFYSIYVKKDGNSEVVKGKGSLYTQEMKISAVQSKLKFRIDSAKVLFAVLDKMKEKPLTKTGNMTDCPRIEIYLHNRKIFDEYNWNDEFWHIVRLIITKLPENSNPFIAEPFPF